jgi:hypothetical protein
MMPTTSFGFFGACCAIAAEPREIARKMPKKNRFILNWRIFSKIRIREV